MENFHQNQQKIDSKFVHRVNFHQKQLSHTTRKPLLRPPHRLVLSGSGGTAPPLRSEATQAQPERQHKEAGGGVSYVGLA
jgi:hypothetical protein